MAHWIVLVIFVWGINALAMRFARNAVRAWWFTIGASFCCYVLLMLGNLIWNGDFDTDGVSIILSAIDLLVLLIAALLSHALNHRLIRKA